MTLFGTGRFNIRHLQETDFPGFHELQSNHNVMRYATGEPKDEAANREELQRCIACYDKPDNDFWIWAIIHRADDKFVGTCALVPADNPEDGQEVGYRLIESEWGKGYGTEVAHGFISFCLDILKVKDLVAFVDSRNTASVKILNRSRLSRVEFCSSDVPCDLKYVAGRSKMLR